MGGRRRGGAAETEPRLDRRLFLGEAMRESPPPPQFGEQLEAQKAGDGIAAHFHAPIHLAQPAAPRRHSEDLPRQEGWQDRTEFLDARLEAIENRERLVAAWP